MEVKQGKIEKWYLAKQKMLWYWHLHTSGNFYHNTYPPPKCCGGFINHISPSKKRQRPNTNDFSKDTNSSEGTSLKINKASVYKDKTYTTTKTLVLKKTFSNVTST